MAASIAGLGISEVGKVYGRSATNLAADAVRRAAGDAAIDIKAIDGLIISGGLKRDLTMSLANVLSLKNLRLLTEIQALGASAGAMVAFAAAAVSSGAANIVACVYADAPLQPSKTAGSSYTARSHKPITGLNSYMLCSGLTNATAYYALATHRHMQTYGTTSEQLGHIAVAQRQWAALNPLAQLREPITLADHQNSRFIAEPLRLLDCCLVSNGGAAVIVTSTERARDLPQPPVDILGWGQGHPVDVRERGSGFGLRTGAVLSGPIALRMADVSITDIDLVQLYDSYTFTTLISLEDYGFCAKGDGGPFVADGRLGPGGTFPLNTGGGQLSSFYLWGMTPLHEAIVQGRGHAGERQVKRREVMLVSGSGGILDHHSTLILGGNR
ncbi:thiolase family protein [Mycobacteroides abscessus]|uniref:thiolase family protein n=1 Tax=Mycobacteroides abscessus TaxID=36809 RepID=UPI003AF760E7